MTEKEIFAKILAVGQKDSPVISELERLILTMQEIAQDVNLDISENLTQIQNYDACILTNEELLTSADLEVNKLTPVIYVGTTPIIFGRSPMESREVFEEACNKEYNLYGSIFEIEPSKIRKKIEDALIEKFELTQILQTLTPEKREEIISQNYEPPKFNSLLDAVVKESGKKASDSVVFTKEELEFFKRILPKNPEKRQFILHDILMGKMLDFDSLDPNSPLVQELSDYLGPLAVELYKKTESGIRPLPSLSEGISGEESIVERFERSIGRRTSHTLPEFRYKIAKFFKDDNKGNNHKAIAKQRYDDADKLQRVKALKVARLTKPLHLDQYGLPVSFVLMQDIEGPGLNKVLSTINEELRKADSQYQQHFEVLKKLRSELVVKYVDDVAKWINLGNEGVLPTFLKKPKGEQLRENYFKSLSQFPETFENIAPGLFNDAEEIAFLEGLNLLDRINFSSEFIVRDRDAALNNVNLRFDKVKYDNYDRTLNLTIDDVIRNLTKPSNSNGLVVDRDAINEKFYHIDLHYRWGHILEDFAHIVTEDESAFLIKADDGVNDKVIKNLTHRFADMIDMPEIKKDKLSVYLMCFYRTARKLTLFSTKYAENVKNEYEAGVISKVIYNRRKKQLQQVIMNHSRSASYILNRVRRIQKGVKMDSSRRKKIDELYQLSHHTSKLIPQDESYERMHKLMIETENAQDEETKLYGQATILSIIYNKLKNYCETNQLNFDKNGN